jgi:hypothetical protein
VKELGRTLGIYVLVTNCTDQMRYTDCAKLFKGLCQGRLWGCFDELNKSQLPVLAIQNAKKANVSHFQFPDDPQNVLLKSVCDFFITMNPGHVGWQELLENFKALFRGVATRTLDREIIVKVKLCSVGYTEFFALAKKCFILYRLCEEQLSKHKHSKLRPAKHPVGAPVSATTTDQARMHILTGSDSSDMERSEYACNLLQKVDVRELAAFLLKAISNVQVVVAERNKKGTRTLQILVFFGSCVDWTRFIALVQSAIELLSVATYFAFPHLPEACVLHKTASCFYQRFIVYEVCRFSVAVRTQSTGTVQPYILNTALGFNDRGKQQDPHECLLRVMDAFASSMFDLYRASSVLPVVQVTICKAVPDSVHLTASRRMCAAKLCNYLFRQMMVRAQRYYCKMC